MGNSVGRPEAIIDWVMVDNMLHAGCLTTEIAARLGICTDTLYNRCVSDKNIDFSAYSQQKKANGEAFLREKQYEKAMSGDNTLLVWLGKQRLSQKDKHTSEEKEELLENLVSFLRSNNPEISRPIKSSGSAMENK